MSGWSQLDRFLQTDPVDVGCGEAMAVLEIYAELAAADPEEAARRLPGVTSHLRSCGPCSQDLEGLLVALLAEG